MDIKQEYVWLVILLIITAAVLPNVLSFWSMKRFHRNPRLLNIIDRLILAALSVWLFIELEQQGIIAIIIGGFAFLSAAIQLLLLPFTRKKQKL